MNWTGGIKNDAVRFYAARRREVSGRMDRWLLVCDIDGTLLLPDLGNPGLDEFNRFVGERRDRIVFALNSGRSLAEIAAVAEYGPILHPDWLITGIGTALWSGFGQDAPDAGWAEAVNRPWGRDAIRDALRGCPGLEDQEDSHQHAAKLSYYLRGDPVTAIAEVSRRVERWKSSCRLIVTLDTYLDVMPVWGGKGAPVEYLARKLAIPRERIIAAGDSGNDRDMLERGFLSVVVANYAPDLRDLPGSPGVYLSAAPAAVGVLEALGHFGLK